MPPRKSSKLEAENVALRQRVQELERELYPPPPPTPEPEPERETCYILWGLNNSKFPDTVIRDMARLALEMARERMPEVRWATVYRTDDIPAGSRYIDGAEMTRVTFSGGGQVTSWYKPTEEERARYQAASEQIKAAQDVLRKYDDTLFDKLRRPKTNGQSRVSLARWEMVDAAEKELWDRDKALWGRAFRGTFDDLTQDVMAIARDTVARARALKVGDLPRLPDGSWPCAECGGAMDDSSYPILCTQCGDKAEAEWEEIKAERAERIKQGKQTKQTKQVVEG